MQTSGCSAHVSEPGGPAAFPTDGEDRVQGAGGTGSHDAPAASGSTAIESGEKTRRASPGRTAEAGETRAAPILPATHQSFESEQPVLFVAVLVDVEQSGPSLFATFEKSSLAVEKFLG